MKIKWVHRDGRETSYAWCEETGEYLGHVGLAEIGDKVGDGDPAGWYFCGNTDNKQNPIPALYGLTSRSEAMKHANDRARKLRPIVDVEIVESWAHRVYGSFEIGSEESCVDVPDNFNAKRTGKGWHIFTVRRSRQTICVHVRSRIGGKK